MITLETQLSIVRLRELRARRDSGQIMAGPSFRAIQRVRQSQFAATNTGVSSMDPGE
jgi:hypothetical protein